MQQTWDGDLWVGTGGVRQHLHQVRFSSANVPSAPRSCNANLWSWHRQKLLLKLG